jgi:elongation factor P
MLEHNDLKRGVRFLLDGEPYEVIDSTFIFKGRGSSTVQAKIKNLINGKVVTKTFHQDDEFEELETKKVDLEFIYSKDNKYFFKEINNPSKRYFLDDKILLNRKNFLKPGMKVTGYFYEEKLLNINLPIKMIFKVTEASIGLRGGREQAGTKPVTIETGAIINVPLFIKTGDLIEVNTETGEYVRRVIE